MEQCRLHVKKYPFSQHGIINYWNTFSECGNGEKIFTNATDIYFRQEGGYTNDGVFDRSNTSFCTGFIQWMWDFYD